MSDVTFRDFAGAVMAQDSDKASGVLAELLGIDETHARLAASYFLEQMASSGPAFMTKAMGLRTAVTGGSDDQIRTLLAECFGLEEESLATAVKTLRQRYPA